jgi:hypothetical protein
MSMEELWENQYWWWHQRFFGGSPVFKILRSPSTIHPEFEDPHTGGLVCGWNEAVITANGTLECHDLKCMYIYIYIYMCVLVYIIKIYIYIYMSVLWHITTTSDEYHTVPTFLSPRHLQDSMQCCHRCLWASKSGLLGKLLVTWISKLRYQRYPMDGSSGTDQNLGQLADSKQK